MQARKAALRFSLVLAAALLSGGCMTNTVNRPELTYGELVAVEGASTTDYSHRLRVFVRVRPYGAQEAKLMTLSFPCKPPEERQGVAVEGPNFVFEQTLARNAQGGFGWDLRSFHTLSSDGLSSGEYVKDAEGVSRYVKFEEKRLRATPPISVTQLTVTDLEDLRRLIRNDDGAPARLYLVHYDPPGELEPEWVPQGAEQQDSVDAVVIYYAGSDEAEVFVDFMTKAEREIHWATYPLVVGDASLLFAMAYPLVVVGTAMMIVVPLVVLPLKALWEAISPDGDPEPEPEPAPEPACSVWSETSSPE